MPGGGQWGVLYGSALIQSDKGRSVDQNSASREPEKKFVSILNSSFKLKQIYTYLTILCIQCLFKCNVSCTFYIDHPVNILMCFYFEILYNGARTKKYLQIIFLNNILFFIFNY